MSPFLSKSPSAKFNATSAGGMQLTAVDVCSPIARLLLNPAEGYGIKYEGKKSEWLCSEFLSFCLSPPLLGIIYIGLNHKFVDVSVVWSS